MSQNFIIGLLVSNHFSVLDRITGVYRKRGINIDSISVGTTEDEHISRMTIVSTGDENVQEQIVKQLKKLYDVKQAILYDNSNTFTSGHLFIKIDIINHTFEEVREFFDSFGGKILDVRENIVCAEVTGETNRLDILIEESKKYGIIELCRSGIIAMAKGMENTLDIKK